MSGMEYENDFEDYAESELLDNLFGEEVFQENVEAVNETIPDNEAVTKAKGNSQEGEGIDSMPPVKKILYLNEQLSRKMEHILQLTEQNTAKDDYKSILDAFGERLSGIEEKIQDLIYHLKQQDEVSTIKKKIFLQTGLKKARDKKKLKQKNEELIELLTKEFNELQLEQIQMGIEDGLELREIKSYAKKELSASAMEKIRYMYLKVRKENDYE